MSSFKYCRNDQNFVPNTCHVDRNISTCNNLYGKLPEEKEIINENQKFLWFAMKSRPF